jgi:signal transduction histidine kinase
MSGNVSLLLVGFVLGLLAMGLGIVLVREGSRWWRTRQFGPSLDHSLLMVEYGRKMTSVPHRQALRELLVGEFPSALGTKRAVLLLTEGHHLLSGEKDDLRLPINHAAVRWVASGGDAQRTGRGKLGELVPQKPTDLTWTQVWVPLMRGIDLHGLWLLGPRSDELGYSEEDLRCLTAIGRHAAVVLETIRYAEQEAERARIARELHDGVLQDLCAVTRDLKALEASEASSESSPRNLAVRSGETVSALRAICSDLRPPLLQQDVISALKTLVKDLDSRSPSPVHIEVSVDDLRLTEEMALTIFRITQEALHNAIQHADASEIAVRLTQYPDHLRLTVTDDGRGIEGGVDPARFVAQGSYGLAGMRERANMIGGKLEVQTAIDYGTVVIFELPL